MTRELILIRHPQVDADHRETCYGQLDVPLALGWENALREVYSCLKRLSSEQLPTVIWHSGLQRTNKAANWLARQLGIATRESELLKERNFGSWQGQRWDAIPEEEVKQSHDMIYRPLEYRPGGGETTDEVQRRVLRWLVEATALEPPRNIVAISHSGPITCLAGAILNVPATEWEPYYLKPSQHLVFKLT